MSTCIFPWFHLIYHTDGYAYPCCKVFGEEEYKVGLTSESPEALFNSPTIKKLRQQLKNGQMPEVCKRHCIDGKQPFKHLAPQKYQDLQTEYFKNTQEDGTFAYNLKCWEINVSNICNFKCLYCSSQHSTMFDGAKLKTCFKTTEELLSVAKETLKELDILYLVGGEPHLNESFYSLLDLLLEQGRSDIEVQFSTNMSGYMYKGRNMYELLNNFKNVKIFGSLDCSGTRLEYIRRGANWNQIEANREAMCNYPNIKFAAQPTVTNLSVLNLFDFHKDWIEKGYLTKDNLRLYCLTNPEELSVNVMPSKLKVLAYKKLDEYKAYLGECTDKELNLMTVPEKITHIQQILLRPNNISKEKFEAFMQNQNDKFNYLDVFPEFRTAMW